MNQNTGNVILLSVVNEQPTTTRPKPADDDNTDREKTVAAVQGVFTKSFNPQEFRTTSFYLRLRKHIFLFFDDADSRKSAYFFSMYFVVLILFSTLALCLETEPALVGTDDQAYAWSVIETLIIAQFTADYVIRLASCPHPLKYAIKFLNVVDFLAIIPYWIQLFIIVATGARSAVSGLAVIRVLRLFRVFRLLKLARNSQQLKLVAAALRRSRDGIILLIFLITLAAILFASAMFYSESAYCYVQDGFYYYNENTLDPDGFSPFQSIFGSMWWAVVTMTTVGYGDAFPITAPGKVVGVITMMCGVLVIAFPITIIGSNLSEVYAEFKAEKIERKRIAQARREAKRQKKLAKQQKRQEQVMAVRLREHDIEAMALKLSRALDQIRGVTEAITSNMEPLSAASVEAQAIHKSLIEFADTVPAYGPLSPREPGSIQFNDTVRSPRTGRRAGGGFADVPSSSGSDWSTANSSSPPPTSRSTDAPISSFSQMS